MPKTLLLADDSITIQKVVAITFANEDFKITSVDNGEDAITKARELKPDIILADVVMPRKNGYEVCDAVKGDPGLKHIPVLLLAGTFEAFDEGRARAVAADGHISKPFESQALIDRVKSLVQGGAGVAASQAPAVAPAPSAPLAGGTMMGPGVIPAGQRPTVLGTPALTRTPQPSIPASPAPAPAFTGIPAPRPGLGGQTIPGGMAASSPAPSASGPGVGAPRPPQPAFSLPPQPSLGIPPRPAIPPPAGALPPLGSGPGTNAPTGLPPLGAPVPGQMRLAAGPLPPLAKAPPAGLRPPSAPLPAFAPLPGARPGPIPPPNQVAGLRPPLAPLPIPQGGLPRPAPIPAAPLPPLAPAPVGRPAGVLTPAFGVPASTPSAPPAPIPAPPPSAAARSQRDPFGLGPIPAPRAPEPVAPPPTAPEPVAPPPPAPAVPEPSSTVMFSPGLPDEDVLFEEPGGETLKVDCPTCGRTNEVEPGRKAIRISCTSVFEVDLDGHVVRPAPSAPPPAPEPTIELDLGGEHADSFVSESPMEAPIEVKVDLAAAAAPAPMEPVQPELPDLQESSLELSPDLADAPSAGVPSVEVAAIAEAELQIDAEEDFSSLNGQASAPRPAPVQAEPPARAPVAPAPRPAAPVAAPPPRSDGDAVVEAQLRDALSKASREMIERIAWEVVPQLAEAIDQARARPSHGRAPEALTAPDRPQN